MLVAALLCAAVVATDARAQEPLPKGRYLVHARGYDATGLYDASPAKETFRVRGGGNTS